MGKGGALVRCRRSERGHGARMDLTAQTVLVTGADGGIGRALVRELAKRDVHLLAGMRDTAGFVPVSERGARQVRPVRIELSSRAEIESCLAELDGERVDVVINNAGRFEGGLLEQQDLDHIYAMSQVNFAGLIHLTKALLGPMLARGHGKIVNNASIAGYVPFPGAAVYSATKAGVVGFSQALRRELSDTEVTVLEVITPGVETDMLAEVREDYEPHVDDTSKLKGIEPGEWAEKIVDAIEDDDDLLNPTGSERLAKLASRGPGQVLDTVLGRVFDR
jgi:short-subunit dehydrogenase